MKFCFSIILVFLLIVSCQRNYDTIKDGSELIPESSDLIIRANDLQYLNTTLLQHSKLLNVNDLFLERIKNSLQQLEPKKDIYISIKNNSYSKVFSLITEFDDKLIKLDSASASIHIKNSKQNLGKISIKKDTIYYKVYNNYFLGSNDKDIFIDFDTNRNASINRLVSSSDNSKQTSIIYNTDSLPDALLLPKVLKTKLSERTLLDLEFQNNNFQFEGVTTSIDATDIINVFKNTIPQALKLQEVISQNATSFRRIAFDDFNIFANNLFIATKRPQDSVSNILSYSNEVGLVKTETSDYIVLSALDIELLKTQLISAASEDTFREIEIYKFESNDFFSERLKPLITYDNANYFCIIDAFAIFAEDITTLKSIISDKLNQNTLSNSPKFKSVLDKLSDESSFFIFKNKSELKNIENGAYNAAAVQFSYDINFAHINGHFVNYKTPARQNSVTEHFSLSLPKDLIIDPQTVKNHITKGHDIITQDVDNTLYLVSDAGKIRWKKKLDGQILGQVQQIDTYKNGRLQLAFATENRVYVLDRNGNDVGKFPLKFNDPITQPLSVFDYDKKKNYRLLVTQGKSLLMYDAKGKSIKGFKHKDTKNNINTQPKHFRISRKDYIVYSQGEYIEILNRQGRIRIPVKTKIRFSNNAIYLYKNQFTTTNTLGELVQINTNGIVSKKPLKLPDNHSITTTSKTLVSLSDNTLNIRNRRIDLDFGNYTQPRIFYLNDKIYVSVTDQQSNKVYLFDSQAKTIPNFPVFGTSKVILEKLDTRRGLELITQTDSKTITVYKLN